VQAQGFVIDPTCVRRPRDKARVERAVPSVREDCFGGEVRHALETTAPAASRFTPRMPPGRRAIDRADLPPEKTAYALRDVGDWRIRGPPPFLILTRGAGQRAAHR
jgi:hypothetical protein